MTPSRHVLAMFAAQVVGVFSAGGIFAALLLLADLPELVYWLIFLPIVITGWLIPSWLFGSVIPARCEKCGQWSAHLQDVRPYTYVCRRCGKKHRTKWREAEQPPYNFDR